MMRNMTSLIGRLNEKNRIRSLLQFLAIAAQLVSVCSRFLTRFRPTK